MRKRLALVLLLAGCASAAAEASPFRAALAAGGGCGRHRALAADLLGSLDGDPVARPGERRDVDLFGKAASAWSEAEIRDAGAAFAACEARLSGAHADPGPVRRFESALRRTVILARALEPAEEVSEVPQQRAADGSARTAPRPGERGLRQGAAFIPAKVTAGKAGPGSTAAPARDPSQMAAEAFRDAERIERAETPAATSADMPAAGPGAGTASGANRERGPQLALSAAFGAPRHAAFAPDAGEPRPAGSPNCAVGLRSFELLQADMRMPEVESLLGCRGASDGTATIPGLGTFETYSWTDRGGTFSVTLVFQGQRLKSKAQRGLVN
ncbi:hypothetical protein [Methylobacterium radiodurans]|uniref:Uncharacterized protein n=1 Tax=Methylobacterium radiodurans TaxID=2202828 RepID=A0A2U8VMV9_9HYPH|nr:hypothetical protein [Methylobacterium radiodurans]AWN34954.1 hypothetical protein DK427_03680 [Methylobacterium radiodurans]